MGSCFKTLAVILVSDWGVFLLFFLNNMGLPHPPPPPPFTCAKFKSFPPFDIKGWDIILRRKSSTAAQEAYTDNQDFFVIAAVHSRYIYIYICAIRLWNLAIHSSEMKSSSWAVHAMSQKLLIKQSFQKQGLAGVLLDIFHMVTFMAWAMFYRSCHFWIPRTYIIVCTEENKMLILATLCGFSKGQYVRHMSTQNTLIIKVPSGGRSNVIGICHTSVAPFTLI